MAGFGSVAAPVEVRSLPLPGPVKYAPCKDMFFETCLLNNWAR